MTYRHLASLAAALSCAAVVACSSAPSESRETSNESLAKCPPGESLQEDIGPGGRIIRTCEPDPPPAPAYYDNCYSPGGTPQMPPALQAAGCATGRFVSYVNQQPVWLCPSTTVVPKSLTHYDGPPNQFPNTQPCYDAQGNLVTLYPYACEATWSGTHLGTNCFSDAPPGMILVAEVIFPTYCGGQGPCGGGCAIGTNPPFRQ